VQIAGSTGSALTTVAYPEHRYAIMDQVSFDASCNHDRIAATRASVEIDGETTPGGWVGNFTVHGGCNRDQYPAFNLNPLAGGFTIDNLTLDGLTAGPAPQVNAANAPSQIGSLLTLTSLNGITVHHLNVSHAHAVTTGAGTNNAAIFIGVSASGRVDDLNVSDSFFSTPSVGSGVAVYLLSGAGPTPQVIRFRNNQFLNLNTAVRAASAAYLVFDGNTFNATYASATPAALVISSTGIVSHWSKNSFSGYSNGIVRYSGAFVTTANSAGDNDLQGTSVWIGNGGSNATGSIFNGLTEVAQVTVPAVNSCGTGSALGTNSNSLAGTISVPASVTSCVYNLASNAFPSAPRAIQCSDQTSGVTLACSVSWTSATTGTMTLAGGSIASTTVSYSVVP
jgi:hypothetical protein